MLVSVAIGAIEREKSLMPETILERLNLALIDRTGGGFVTCCCVRIEASGLAWVASAGHPAPYLRGHEIQFEAGLPLGIVRDAAYQSYEFQLQPEDQLTIVSDGVLEAENEPGELFGFERTRALCNKSAIEIAQSARAWARTTTSRWLRYGGTDEFSYRAKGPKHRADREQSPQPGLRPKANQGQTASRGRGQGDKW